jgi:hypothetical protein
MKRFALRALTFSLCLGSTAWADLVSDEIHGAGTTVDSFFVMCASDERSDVCTDTIKVTPVSVQTGSLASSDPMREPLGALYSGALVGSGQEGGDTKRSADFMTTSFVATNRDDKRITLDPAPPTTVPEPASVLVIGAFLVVFVISSLRASRKRTGTYRLRW